LSAALSSGVFPRHLPLFFGFLSRSAGAGTADEKMKKNFVPAKRQAALRADGIKAQYKKPIPLGNQAAHHRPGKDAE